MHYTNELTRIWGLGVSRVHNNHQLPGSHPRPLRSYNVAVPRFKKYSKGYEAAQDARAAAGMVGKRHGYAHSGGGQLPSAQNKPAAVPRG